MKKQILFSLACFAGVGMSAVSGAQTIFTDDFSTLTNIGNPATGSGVANYSSGFLGEAANTWSVIGNIDAVGAAYEYNGDTTTDYSKYSGKGAGGWVDLAGSPGPGGISTNLNVSTAGTYVISFDALSAPRLDKLSYDFQTIVNNSTVYSGVAGIHNMWGNYSETVSLLQGQNTVEFYSNFAGYGNAGISNIKITAAQPAPEPMTVALAGAGALIGLAMIRRRAV